MLNFTAAASGVFGRATIAGVAIAASLAFAAPASAGITLVDAKFYDASTAGQTDGRYFTIMSPFETTMKAGALTFDALAFCIELDVDMPIVDPYEGVATTLNLHYDESLLAANADRIGRLVNYGTSLYGSGLLAGGFAGSPLSIELAAIQGAIWRLTSGEDVHFSPDAYDVTELAAYNPKIDLYETGLDLSGYSNKIHTVYSRFDDEGEPLGQGIAYAGTLAVPEPAVWGLMLTGFFGAGSMLRRRRALSAI